MIVRRHVGQVATDQRDLGRYAVLPDTRRDDDQRGERADDDRVDEGLEQRDDALRDRLVGLGGSVGDRCGTLAGLVGEQAAPHAPHHRHHEDAHPGAGNARCRIERFTEDEQEAGNDRLPVQHQDHQRSRHVDPCHDRREDAGDGADATDAADDDREHDGRGDQARHPRGDPEGREHRVGHGVGLDRVAGHEGRHAEQDREDHRQRLPLVAEAALDVVHRPASYGAFPFLGVVIGARDRAVVLGQRDLGVLGRHAEKRGDPHPEERAGTTEVNRDRHAGDVADPYRGRQRRGERLEVRDIARLVRVVVLARGDGNAVAESPNLQEPEIEGQVQTGADQGDHDQRQPLFTDGESGFPDPGVQPGNEAFEESASEPLQVTNEVLCRVARWRLL